MFGRLLRIFKKQSQVGPLKDDQRIWTPLRLLLQGQGLNEPYRQHAVVYACIGAIATNISQVPFRLYKQKGEGKETVEEGPLYDLFNNPNPLLSGEQLWEATAIWYCLRGEAVWIVGRENVAQVPKEVWVFDPQRFELVTDRETGLPIGWKYRGKKEIKLALDEVIFFKAYNPYNDLRGLSPIQAAEMGIEQDWWATRHNLAFFKNAAEPGGALTTDQELNDDQYDRIKKTWEDRHQGPDKAHRIAILEGGLKYQKITLSPRDMEFLEQRRWNREEIAMVYRVPMHVLNVYKDIKTYAGLRVLDKVFWEQNLIPKMGYFEGAVFSKLFSFINNGQVWGEFDLSVVEALQEDFNDKVGTAHKLWQMGWPINKINERLNLGFEPVPWGDEWFVPWNLAPASSLVGGAAPPKAGEGKEKGLLADVAREIRWKRYVKMLQPHEDRMTGKIRRFFYEQRKRVLDALFSLLGKDSPQAVVKDYTDDILDSEKEDELLRIMIVPLFSDAVQGGIEAAAEELGLVDFEFTAGDPAAAKFIETKAIKITQINETVREQIRKAINEGLVAGDTVTELADRIRKVYNFASTRAMTIARTESGSCIQGGKFLARQEAGVKLHEWVTARDEHVRSSHVAQDGKVVAIGEKFPNGCRYPNDPNGEAGEIINCRCDAAAVVQP